ncbi:MFS transporter [Pontibacillus sp. HMF3514]|uniref:MFS transporter n=1 Tax=Pontibacillus sp. HMF3514 TaxID=2692425 RepID=UPI00132022BC|nr:MFS transporter [Pontibacillus sp. HMF3514]QHE51561.1 MFS transporter [Pontibacillus sp. HMF3514]
MFNLTNHEKNMSVIVSNQFLTALADSVYDVAIFWYIYDQSGSALLASFVTAISFLTQVIVGPFIGVLADYKNPKWTMQLGFALMIFVGISMAFIYYFLLDYFVILLYLGVIIHDIGMATIKPARSKLLPRIVGRERIVQVNGYISSSSQIALTLGKSMSGFLIALIGFIGVMLSHAALYLLASILLKLLIDLSLSKTNESAGDVESVREKKEQSYISDIKDTFQLMRSFRPLFKLIIIGMVINVASVIGPLFVVIVREQYSSGSIVFGWFNAIGAVAGVVVGLFANRIINFVKPYMMFGLSMSGAGLSMMLVGTLSNIYAGMTVYFIMSFLLTVFNIAFSSLIITLVEDEYRGRVNNLTTALATIMIPVFSVLGGYVADQLSASIVYVFAGVWVVFWGIVIFIDKDVRAIESV